MSRHLRGRLAIATIVATALLAAASPAGATRSIELTGEVANFEGRATLLKYSNFEEPEEVIAVECEVTATFRLTGMIAKRAGGEAGQLRTIRAANCMGGEVVEYLTGSLPWPIQYLSFTGALPSITSMRFQVVGFRLLLRTVLYACLYRGNPQFTTVGSPMTQFRWDETRRIALSDGTLSLFRCPPAIALSGALRVPAIRMALR